MSINNKTNTLYEKIDVISNLIEQLFLMNATRDNQNFAVIHKKAINLCFDALKQMEEMGLDNQ